LKKPEKKKSPGFRIDSNGENKKGLMEQHNLEAWMAEPYSFKICEMVAFLLPAIILTISVLTM
jgi:hypothetical protein